MSHFIGSLAHSDHARSHWMARATMENAMEATRYVVSLMRQASARERTRRQLGELDARMLRDIGLDPLDVYYDWRGPRH